MADRKGALESMEIKRVLVTGSDGYIGSVLVEYLIRAGYEVAGVDTCFYYKNLLGSKPVDYELKRKDLRLVETVDLENFDAVIHLAALSNDPVGALNPALTNEINYKATVGLARLAKKCGVKRFLFSSSCSIYGVCESEVDEKSSVNPLTAYAKSKIQSEKALRTLVGNDFCVGLLRNATVYGYSPKFRNDLVVNNLLTSGFVFNKIKILSDGSPWRPLIDIRDLCEIFIGFLKIEKEAINGEVFNVGFWENNLQVKEIAEVVKKVLGGCEVEYTGEHGRDTRSYRVSFAKFKNIFRIKQKWPLEKSIRDLVGKLRKYEFNDDDFIGSKFSRVQTLKNLLLSQKLDDKLYWKKRV